MQQQWQPQLWRQWYWWVLVGGGDKDWHGWGGEGGRTWERGGEGQVEGGRPWRLGMEYFHLKGEGERGREGVGRGRGNREGRERGGVRGRREEGGREEEERTIVRDNRGRKRVKKREGKRSPYMCSTCTSIIWCTTSGRWGLIVGLGGRSGHDRGTSWIRSRYSRIRLS